MNRDKLYEKDEHLWLSETANYYKDDKNLFEYLLEMSKREEREVKSRMQVLLLHLLKWKYQPSMRSSSWAGSIKNASEELTYIFEDSTTIYHKYLYDNYYDRPYKSARFIASKETGLPLATFPETIPWDVEKVWTEEFVDDALNNW